MNINEKYKRIKRVIVKVAPWHLVELLQFIPNSIKMLKDQLCTAFVEDCTAGCSNCLKHI